MRQRMVVALLGLVMGALVLLAAQTPAHAYIDPGTGSYLFQLAIAGFLGGAFVLRLYWRKLMRMLGRRSGEDEEEE